MILTSEETLFLPSSAPSSWIHWYENGEAFGWGSHHSHVFKARSINIAIWPFLGILIVILAFLSAFIYKMLIYSLGNSISSSHALFSRQFIFLCLWSWILLYCFQLCLDDYRISLLTSIVRSGPGRASSVWPWGIQTLGEGQKNEVQKSMSCELCHATFFFLQVVFSTLFHLPSSESQ